MKSSCVKAVFPQICILEREIQEWHFFKGNTARPHALWPGQQSKLWNFWRSKCWGLGDTRSRSLSERLPWDTGCRLLVHLPLGRCPAGVPFFLCNFSLKHNPKVLWSWSPQCLSGTWRWLMLYGPPAVPLLCFLLFPEQHEHLGMTLISTAVTKASMCHVGIHWNEMSKIKAVFHANVLLRKPY